jgi:hypothetical protein
MPTVNIHQLSVNYIQEHDRVLVRINTTAAEELRLWFTRRLTLGLMPVLNKVVADWVAQTEAVKSPHISPAATADAQTRQMLAEFKREESLQQSDFKTPYKAEAVKLPLGPEPLLVTEVSVTPLPNGQLQVALSEKLPDHPSGQAPRGFRMALEQKLVHGFVHLLDKAIQTSQWTAHTAPSPAQTEPPLPGEPSGERPKYLN